MDRIGLVGSSWRRGGPEAVAALTIPEEHRDDWLRGIAARMGLREIVYLATCNRVEILYVPEDGTALTGLRQALYREFVGRDLEVGEAERALRAWGGEGAVEHLFLVTAGLDSARIGEPEITGQVKLALERSRALGLVGARLELVFEEAFAVARRVRRETGLGQGRHSLAEIAVDPVRTHLGTRPGRVAVVGTSPMCRRVALALARGKEGHEIIVVNRTPERAREMAAEAGAPVMSLADFRTAPPAVDAILLATAAPEPVLSRGDLERVAARTPAGRPLLVVDLAVPPDVDPADAAAVGVMRIGIDELLQSAEAERAHHEDAARVGHELVEQALVQLPARLVDSVLSPLFAAVQDRYQQTAKEGLERLFRKELTGLGGDERAALSMWAETLARRFAHLPTAGLRGVAEHGGMAAVGAFLSHADARLVDTYHEISQRGAAPLKAAQTETEANPA